MARDTRRVKHSIRAWHADVSDSLEHLPKHVIATGAPIVIEPMEELHILRRPMEPDDLALVSCRGALYLIPVNDLDHGTIRVSRAGHG